MQLSPPVLEFGLDVADDEPMLKSIGGVDDGLLKRQVMLSL